MRCIALVLALVLFGLTGCSPLYEEKTPEGLVDLKTIPAAYGQLVAVTQYPSSEQAKPGWYELWFSNPETGVITHVPVYRAGWRYLPDRIKVFERN